MNYKLSYSTWSQEEREAILDVVNSDQMTMGAKVKEFEKSFADWIGSKYAVMVNSGSSANLLALSSLFYKEENPLRRGDEIILPALSWSTTCAPAHQCGLLSSFVDIDFGTLNLSPFEVSRCVTPRTKAIMLVNTLGNPAYLDWFESFCKGKKYYLIEDNCESLGAVCKGRKAGTFGICGTHSFFFSHHMCTGEGGMITTDDEEIYHILLSLRSHGWKRELPDYVDSFQNRYNFILPGYNLRPMEIQGAVGLIQLSKLDGFLEERRKNAKHFLGCFWESSFDLQLEYERSSWFGFVLLCEEGKRERYIEKMNEAGIEVRPVIAGNFTRQKTIKHMEYVIRGGLPNSGTVDRCGFYVGNAHFDITDKIDYLAEVLNVG